MDYNAPPLAARKDGLMVGQVLTTAADAFGFACGLVGAYFGLVAVVSSADVLTNLNQFLVQASALVGTLGCFFAAVSIAWRNGSAFRRQVRDDVLGNRDAIAALERAVAEKDVEITRLTRTAADALALAGAATDRGDSLERELAVLHETIRHNSRVVSTLKMESDLRNATPDPDRRDGNGNAV